LSHYPNYLLGGSTGGQDIIDNGDVGVPKILFRLATPNEAVLDQLLPLHSGKGALGRTSATGDEFVGNGNSERLTNSCCQQRALVEAPSNQ
jgi:hypothetical protein